MDFKVIFPAGYEPENDIGDALNIYNDCIGMDNGNIDINIVLENGDVYFATLFTLRNIEYFLAKDKEPCFWATDMLIVKDLSKKTIREAIAQTIKDAYTEMAFTKIGRIETKYRNISFEEISDMSNGFDLVPNDE